MSEVEQEVVNPIEELIDAIAGQNFNQAKTHFDDVLADKMHDALEAEKVSVAQDIYSDEEVEEIDVPEDDELVPYRFEDDLDEEENDEEDEEVEEEVSQDDEVG
jgi:hypothetical protein